MNEISACAKNYAENRCEPSVRVPAMEKTCVIWETCMNRDPAVIGRAKVSAETFAEIINSFVERISYKTMSFVFLSVFAAFFLGNFAFNFVNKTTPSGQKQMTAGRKDQTPPLFIPPASAITNHYYGSTPMTSTSKSKRIKNDIGNKMHLD